jgi:hypothetical protein
VKFFSHKHLPFMDKMLHSYWPIHYLPQPRGQSRCATWQKHLIAWGTEIFHCRQFRSLGSEPLHNSLLGKQTTVRIFFQITHSLPK